MKKMILELLKYGPIVVLIAIGSQAFASNSPILCKSQRGSKIFQIIGNNVSIDLKSDWDSPRRPASVFQNARHKLNSKGLTKIVYFEGNKHTLHISDLNNLESIDNYIKISSKQGHEITYPLDCQRR